MVTKKPKKINSVYKLAIFINYLNFRAKKTQFLKEFFLLMKLTLGFFHVSFLFAFLQKRDFQILSIVLSLSEADLGKNHLKDDLNKDLQLNGQVGRP